MADLQTFLTLLERHGELARVRVEVDPALEITEIATRVVKQEGQALLFERVKGSPYPLAINVLGSARRIELALGRHPQQVGADLLRVLETAQRPSLRNVWQVRDVVGRLRSMRPRHVRRAAVQAVSEAPDLARLPVMQCWPEDAGPFITFGLVLTRDPVTRRRNVGVYRLQLHSRDQTLMHWQIQKGGGFHYDRAERLGHPLEVAVIIGADPALLMAAVAPLPEGMDEIAFAGFLRGQPLPLVQGTQTALHVPAEAEFVLEGVVPPHERAMEGPFGDHFGHYSHQAPFPVLHVQTITRRQRPVYLSAVVGKPPQEDKYIGNAVQEMLLPMIKALRPELRDLWAHYEAGFHSLVAVAVEQRYAKEGMKTALGLLGEGQMALTKCLVVVDPEVNVRDVAAVLRAIREHFDPSADFLLLPGVPFDTLDFTSRTLNVGSKMVVDATRNGQTRPPRQLAVTATDLSRLDARILRARLVEETLLLVAVEGEGRGVVESLVRHPHLHGLAWIAAVSPDVRLEERESWMWGLFTRFDPARDVVFAQVDMHGSWPVYRGVMGIDATFKQGYPHPLVMTDAIQRLVDQRWHAYWR